MAIRLENLFLSLEPIFVLLLSFLRYSNTDRPNLFANEARDKLHLKIVFSSFLYFSIPFPGHVFNLTEKYWKILKIISFISLQSFCSNLWQAPRNEVDFIFIFIWYICIRMQFNINIRAFRCANIGRESKRCDEAICSSSLRAGDSEFLFFYEQLELFAVALNKWWSYRSCTNSIKS